MDVLNWGIIGTGAIAHAFADGLKTAVHGTLKAVGSRSRESAESFASEYPGIRAHGSYGDLLGDPDIACIYISTPHPFHARWAILALEAGKHVLCEKPLALNQWQAQAMVECARRNKRFLGEAFMYRYHPQTARLAELIREELIGEVRIISTSFGFGGGDRINPESRIFNNALGGGAILDVGCYTVSMSRLVAGAAIGKDFADPVEVSGLGQVGSTGVDEWAGGLLKFESGIIARIATSIRAGLENVLVVSGSKGSIKIEDPWTHNRKEAVAGRIHVARNGKEETIDIPADRTSFAIEADGVAAALAGGRLEAIPPAMTWEDSLGNMAVLDRWRKAVGVVYEEEKPHVSATNLTGRRVGVRTSGLTRPMRYGRINGLQKPVSKMIFGALTAQGSFAKAQVLFDHWLDCGGNTFDTAYHYGMGSCDRMLGYWLNSRGVRDDVVILGKGAHTPNCDPGNLVKQLDETLEALGTDHLDIYIMHRDNEEIPVSEFVDVLNECHRKGKIRVFGGSNWSIKRFAEANTYAREKDLEPMRILNNNLSLAEMVDPVWAGCIHLSDTVSRKWMEDTGVVHFSWSSQARGFFTDRFNTETASPGWDEELRRCWFSEANFQRRERCLKLAREKGVSPINIAAAWVLCQPFDSYALIGPESIHEMDTSLPALDVELTRKEIDWLWQG